MDITQLPRDVIIYMAITMDLPELYNLCQTSRRFNELVCENQTFWMNRLEKDYKISVATGGYNKEYYEFITNKLKNVSTALEFGAKNRDLNLVRLSLEKGANIHAHKDYALRVASINGHLKVVKYLLEQGANIHAENDDSLRGASEKGHLEVVKYLIDKGADVHAYSDYALLWASKRGHLEVVKYLIEHGADVHANVWTLRWASKKDIWM